MTNKRHVLPRPELPEREIQRDEAGLVRTEAPTERVYLVGVDRHEPDAIWDVADSMDELALLADTAGMDVVGSTIQRLRTPTPNFFVGKGKLQELRDSRAELDYDAVVFDDELTPTQQRNLEEALSVPVIDRTELILLIFAQRARTREGRLQVELAQLEYELPRLASMWTHLERQRGGTFTRGGAGETQTQEDRRRLRKRISDLKQELEQVRNQRGQSRERRRLEGIPVISLVGYTNAGKSTLLNALSGAQVRAEDILFATLDPTTRRITLPGGQAALLTDTVGFIQKLPTTLVAAFRATLEELEEADVLIHVLDVTDEHAYSQYITVNKIIEDLGLGDRPIITALNKIDRLSDAIHRTEQTQPDEQENGAGEIAMAEAAMGELRSLYKDAVAVSATRGWGIEALLQKVTEAVTDSYLEVTADIPYKRNDLAALFRQKGTITSEEYGPESTRISGRIPAWLRQTFAPYRIS